MAQNEEGQPGQVRACEMMAYDMASREWLLANDSRQKYRPNAHYNTRLELGGIATTLIRRESNKTSAGDGTIGGRSLINISEPTRPY